MTTLVIMQKIQQNDLYCKIALLEVRRKIRV